MQTQIAHKLSPIVSSLEANPPKKFMTICLYWIQIWIAWIRIAHIPLKLYLATITNSSRIPGSMADPNPKCSQNLINSSQSQEQYLHKILSQSIHNFWVILLTNIQTNKPDPDCSQNVMVSSPEATPSRKFMRICLQLFELSCQQNDKQTNNPTNQQTNKQTNWSKNITSLVEVTRRHSESANLCQTLSHNDNESFKNSRIRFQIWIAPTM